MNISIAIAREEPRGVAVTAYSSRLSRVYGWGVDYNTFEPGQFFRGSVKVHDVSPNGKHFIYEVTWCPNRESIGFYVSHIPYFAPLAFFRNLSSDYYSAFFRDDKTIVFVERNLQSYTSDSLIDYIEPNCPYQIQSVTHASIHSVNNAKWCAECFGIEPGRYVAHNRSIYLLAYYIDEPMLIKTFDRHAYKEITTPDWAKIW